MGAGQPQSGLPTTAAQSAFDDEQAMEELFREIFVPVPSGEVVTSSSTIAGEEKEQLEEGDSEIDQCSVGDCEEKKQQDGKDDTTTTTMMDLTGDDSELALSVDEQSVDWASEIEMQRLLDVLQQSSTAQQQAFVGQDFAMNGVDLGLLSWNEVEGTNANGVDVF